MLILPSWRPLPWGVCCARNFLTRAVLFIAQFQSMAYQFPEFGCFALAMTIAMISGGIDLSVIATPIFRELWQRLS